MKTYFGRETKKALKNFPFSVGKTRMEFVFFVVKIKKAVALANRKAGNISVAVAQAISKACDLVLSGKKNDQFPLAYLQGGAGTATNMNVNEVLANLATKILKNKIKVHPNNHVNSSGSTNDINPSALKVSAFFLLLDLERALIFLVQSFEKKSKEFKNIKKLGRTHLQDAVPTTLGAEFSAYAFSLKEHLKHISFARALCQILNLGGTAIGNSVNASAVYRREVYRELNKITGGKFRPAKNLISKTNSQTDFLAVSQAIVSLCVDLSKIADDFKFMASGPRGGIGEIILPELQKGSSIMPGKVNPVMPEAVNQLYYIVSGNNLSIEKAVHGSQMELGVMLPTISEKLIDSIKLTTEVMNQFGKKCVLGVKADKGKCAFFLENSTAYATLLVPRLGYDLVSEIVKKSIKNGKSLKEMVLDGKYLSKKDFYKITGF